MFKMDLEKAEEPEIKLPTSVASQKKQDNFRKTSAAAAKLLQLCPGSSVHGIFQARVLEWVAIAFSEKNIYFCFIDYTKTFNCVDPNKLWKILKEMEYQSTLCAS